MQWWVPIPWLLSSIGILIAIFVYYRKQYQTVKISRLSVSCLGKSPNWDMHEYFQLQLTCIGADIFDIQVYLECDYSYWLKGKKFVFIRKSKFVPLSELPNPFRNGQVATFELGDHDFRDLEKRKYADTRIPSQLKHRAVRIAVYHSGKRLLTYRSSIRFKKLLQQFDSMCDKGSEYSYKRQAFIQNR